MIAPTKETVLLLHQLDHHYHQNPSWQEVSM